MDDALCDAHLVESIDLNEYCVDNVPSSFLVRVSGDSMHLKGIQHDDIAVVDKSVHPREGSVVVAYYQGGFTIKALHFNPLRLVAFDGKDTVYPISEGDEFEVFGCVVSIVRSLKAQG